MEGMASVWGYQETIDELKDMVLYRTYELESVRNDAREEMRKNEENVKQLLHLLKVAYRERDEARDQLQILLNRFMPSDPTKICPILPSLRPNTPPVNPSKGNSSVTESDSLSETYNHHSYGSSPVDSFFNVVSSPDLSNMNVADSSNIGVPHQPFIQEYNGPTTMGIVSSEITKIDRASAVIDNLVKGKPLPQKGKLLQAVMEAGPLLQTILVSGPLPQWRNPPPVQPFKIIPFSIKGCDPETINQKLVSNLNYPNQNSLTSSYPEISNGSSQLCSTSMFNFMSGSGSYLNKGEMVSTGVCMDFMHDQITTGKRQRIQ